MEPDEQHDPLPALIAEIDQMIALAPQIARYAWAIFQDFVEEGFTEVQALQLTMNQIKV